MFRLKSKSILKLGQSRRCFLLFIHIILLFSFCGKKSNTANLKVFHLNLTSSLSSLDPAFARTQENIWAVNQLFNGLLQLDSQMQPSACLATSWTIDSTQTVYTFQLREDVFFHNHPLYKSKAERKLSSADVLYSFQRLMDPKTASPGAWVFNGKVEKFSALDTFKFQVKLTQPFPAFLSLLTMPYCAVVSEKASSVLGANFATHPIGSGPFQFWKWEESVKLIFRKNPGYFENHQGKPLPFLDAISFSFVESKHAAFLAFLQGESDFFNGLESTVKDQILNPEGQLVSKYQNQFKLSKNQFLNTEYLAIQQNEELHKDKPEWKYFKDIRFRKALNYSINRKLMLAKLRNNLGTAADGGFIPKGLPTYQTTQEWAPKYQPDTALKYLKASGYLANPVSFTLYTSKEYLDLCIFIQNAWQQMGIQCQVEVLPGAYLKQQKSQGRLLFFRSSWIADYADEENYFSCFYGSNKAPNGPNYTHYNSQEFDSLYQLSNKQTKVNQRAQTFTQMDSLLLHDLPFVVLFYDQSLRLTQNNIKGLDNNAMNHLSLKAVEKKQ